jgi:hypothetical protein
MGLQIHQSDVTQSVWKAPSSVLEFFPSIRQAPLTSTFPKSLALCLTHQRPLYIPRPEFRFLPPCCRAILATPLCPFDKDLGRAPSLLPTAPSYVAGTYQEHAAAPSIFRGNAFATKAIRRTYPKYVTVQFSTQIRVDCNGRPGFPASHVATRPD